MLLAWLSFIIPVIAEKSCFCKIYSSPVCILPHCALPTTMTGDGLRLVRVLVSLTASPREQANMGTHTELTKHQQTA